MREGGAVVYIVPTCPEQLRHLAARAKTWQSWRKKLIEWLKAELGFRFLHERTDPAGKCRAANADRSGAACLCIRCQKWHPHMNILAPAAGSKCPSGVLSKEQLAALKAAWARIIGWGGDKIDLRVDNSEWNRSKKRRNTPAEAEKKLADWCSYQGRTWPDWQESVRRHMVPRWYGEKIVVPKPEKVKDVCAECKAEYCWLECRAGEEEAEFWASLGPEKCQAELEARLVPDYGFFRYRPVPPQLLEEVA